MTANDGTVVVVPLKSFDTGKSRLRAAMSGDLVHDLIMKLARGVVAAAEGFRTVIVSDNAKVEFWAREMGCECISGAEGLNQSLLAARQRLAAECERLVIVHGDIWEPASLSILPTDYEIVIAPDRHNQGTNVLSLPSQLDFHFSYGLRSALAHEKEARRHGLTPLVLGTNSWGVDIDTTDDLNFAQLQ
ncbi:MAG: hypothetical protein WCG86_01085 [Actinomycetota bacterium]|jgi:2-phospho-L-lactate guanylyltransferase